MRIEGREARREPLRLVRGDDDDREVDAHHRVKPRAWSSFVAWSTRSFAVCSREPLDERRHPVLERHACLESEQLPRKGGVGEAVPDVACAVLPRTRRLHLDPEAPGERRRDVVHGGRPAGPEVDPRSPRRGSSSARTIPSTMSETWMKSRDWRPPRR